VTTNPPGQQITVDGQAPISTPANVSFTPGSQHTIDAPAQDNGAGTRYMSTGQISAISGCDTPRQSVTLNLKMQYSITLSPDPGGSIALPDTTMPNGWQDPGSQLTLVATPSDGFTFTGWEGDCSGPDVCNLTMDGPKNAIAHFASQSGDPS